MITKTIDQTIENKQDNNTFTLDRVNKVNEPFYNDDIKHTITIAISNAINPTFEVYATCLQYALDELGKYMAENELNMLYVTYDELINDHEPELLDEELDNYYQCNNGIYIYMNSVYSIEGVTV